MSSENETKYKEEGKAKGVLPLGKDLVIEVDRSEELKNLENKLDEALEAKQDLENKLSFVSGQEFRAKSEKVVSELNRDFAVNVTVEDIGDDPSKLKAWSELLDKKKADLSGKGNNFYDNLQSGQKQYVPKDDSNVPLKQREFNSVEELIDVLQRESKEGNAEAKKALADLTFKMVGKNATFEFEGNDTKALYKKTSKKHLGTTAESAIEQAKDTIEQRRKRSQWKKVSEGS